MIQPNRNLTMDATREYYRDKVAVVTGGASGIGLAIAELMLSYGVRHAVLADVNDENLKRETARLNSAYAGKVTNEDWEKAFALNFFGPLYGIRAVLPIMRKQSGGHIVDIISGIAFMPINAVLNPAIAWIGNRQMAFVPSPVSSSTLP